MVRFDFRLALYSGEEQFARTGSTTEGLLFTSEPLQNNQEARLLTRITNNPDDHQAVAGHRNALNSAFKRLAEDYSVASYGTPLADLRLEIALGLSHSNEELKVPTYLIATGTPIPEADEEIVKRYMRGIFALQDRLLIDFDDAAGVFLNGANMCLAA